MRKKQCSPAYGLFNFTILAGFMALAAYGYSYKNEAQMLDDILTEAQSIEYTDAPEQEAMETDMQPVKYSTLPRHHLKRLSSCQIKHALERREKARLKRDFKLRQAAAYKDLYGISDKEITKPVNIGWIQ